MNKWDWEIKNSSATSVDRQDILPKFVLRKLLSYVLCVEKGVIQNLLAEKIQRMPTEDPVVGYQ